MQWFRHSDLAEMKEELETEKNLRLLAQLSNERYGSFPAANWTDWFEWWGTCSMDEKNQLLRDISAIYRDFPDFDWWYVWILMFIEELYGMSNYFHRQLNNHDERWSLIVWSFLEVMARSKHEPSINISVIDIREQMKTSINKSIYSEKKIRRVEISMPELDIFPDPHPQMEMAEPPPFTLICRNVELFMNGLSSMDRAIVEEICILGHSGESCALRLGLSRQQVNRRLMHVKTKLSGFLKIPVVKRIKKY